MTDDDTLQLIYEKVLDLWKGSYRIYHAIREKSGQIMIFINIIIRIIWSNSNFS